MALPLRTGFRESVYTAPWQKRGDPGPISNMDRVTLIMIHRRREKAGNNDPYPRIDGSADLAVYALLYLSTYLRKHYPEAFEKWWTEEVQGFLDRYRPPSEMISLPKVA
jgi:hypothetical protein